MPEGTPSLPASATRFRAIVAALLMVVVAAAAYAFHERNVAKQLAAQNSTVTSTLNATRDQMSALTAKLDAVNAERSAEKSAAPHSAVYRKPLTAASMRQRSDDPRWKKIQRQLDEQAKQIDSTRQDLTNTRTDLQGSIATTHDELVMLEKKGERSYYEFDLDKSSQFQREGPVGVRLRKANNKHEYADLEMLVDDLKVSKKHVNIYEPVFFYSGDHKLPVELVINSISKNHIHGYISEPKYKAADLEAMANSSANNKAASTDGLQTASPAKPSPVRHRLEPPNMN
jgi:transcriptional regulator with PAS, ATPase and Fis domain